RKAYVHDHADGRRQCDFVSLSYGPGPAATATVLAAPDASLLEPVLTFTLTARSCADHDHARLEDDLVEAYVAGPYRGAALARYDDSIFGMVQLEIGRTRVVAESNLPAGAMRRSLASLAPLFAR
ncbi:MAG: hypothetical protein ACRDVM_06680, partial [Acidimicrobiia bacterium]